MTKERVAHTVYLEWSEKILIESSVMQDGEVSWLRTAPDLNLQMIIPEFLCVVILDFNWSWVVVTVGKERCSNSESGAQLGFLSL